MAQRTHAWFPFSDSRDVFFVRDEADDRVLGVAATRERRARACYRCQLDERSAIHFGRLVTLPLFPAMTEGDQDDVLDALDKVFAYYAR